MKKTFILILTLCLLASVFGCSKAADESKGGYDAMEPVPAPGEYSSYYSYSTSEPLEENHNDDFSKETVIVENDFIYTGRNNISTFSADVDTGSYTFLRKLISQGYNLEELISTAGPSIRTEEMVNYFDYDYQLPSSDELFGVSVQIADCPWNEDAALMILGLKTEAIEPSAGNNLVFLIDVSGSMNARDKLDLLKTSFGYLVDQLDEDDVVSIVTYSGRESVELEGCPGNKGDKILRCINSLRSGGSTNGEAGLQKAYQLAEEYYIQGGNNRIIMASDGDLNVGISSTSELEEYVAEKRDQGVYLSVLGFGTGNYRDSMMETIADNGNGVYYYIDNDMEAEKVLGTDLISTLYTVAEDVKLQIEFNKDNVLEYRLIGYENRKLATEDFEDDTKDAGEVGAGHTVTVCYELILRDGAKESRADWMNLAIRFKNPGETKSQLNEYGIGGSAFTNEPNDDFRFTAALIELSMILRDSEYGKTISLNDVISTLASLDLTQDQYKEELYSMVKSLS